MEELERIKENLELVVPKERVKQILMMKAMGENVDEDIMSFLLTKVDVIKLKTDTPALKPIEDAEGEIQIGRVCLGERELYDFFITKEMMTKHICILGATGTGKTVLMSHILLAMKEQGIKSLVFDFKGDLKGLKKYGATITPWWFLDMDSLLTPPDNIPYYQYFSLVADVFSHTYGILEAGRGYFIEIMEELYSRNNKISFFELLEYLRGIEFREKSWKRRQYYDVLLNRILAICLVLRPMIEQKYERISLDELLNKNGITILLLESIGYTEANFISSLILMKMFADRQVNPNKRELVCVGIDEAQRILLKKGGYSELVAELGESITMTMFNEFRSFNMSIVLATQMPSELDKSVLANCGTIIVGHLQHGDDINAVQRACNLSEIEESAISGLKKGYWIVKLSESSPFLIKTESLDLSFDGDIPKLKSEPMIKDITISIDAERLLRNVLLNPYIDLTSHYNSINVNADKGKKAKEELVAKEYITEERISIGNVNKVYLVLTKKGFERTDIPVKFWSDFLSSNESFTHLFYKNLIGWNSKKNGYKVVFEAGIGKEKIDVLLIKGSERVAVEVELSNRHTDENIKKIFEQNKHHITKFFVVCPNKKILDKVQKEVPEVVFVTITQFLEYFRKTKGSASVFGKEKEEKVKTVRGYEEVKELDEATVKRFYEFLSHDGFTELRLIDPEKKKQPKQFFVGTENEFLDICKKYNGVYNIYAGINQRKIKSGKKEDINNVKTIVIDIDAVRDKNQGASDYELEMAENVADEIITDCIAKGIRKPIKAMSGNGFHLYFSIPEIKIDEFNRDNVEERIKMFNRKISEKYSNEYATIDNIGDLPRIIKVAGTLSIKGESTEERPHRYSFVYDEFKRDEDGKLLDYIKGLNPKEVKKKPLAPAEHPNLSNLLEKDEKLKTLYTGNWHEYPSRSEAELALLCKLVFYGFPEGEINSIMSSCGIGKWQESQDSYRKLTLQKAYQFVERE